MQVNDLASKSLEVDTWLIARRCLYVVMIVVAFAGLWFWISPFYGAPGSERSNLTAVGVQHGDRARCPAPIALVQKNPLIVVEDYDQMACYQVGVDRMNVGWMLLFGSAVGFIATTLVVRAPRPREKDEH